jgi:enamine deaminase RidA (YjgF/YER057c/UK114 family)
MGQTEKRIEELGLTLPKPPTPIGAYVPAAVAGHFAYVSGQLPVIDGQVIYRGKAGLELTIDEAYTAARLCGLRLIAALKDALGDLDRVSRIVKLTGFVNSAADFKSHPAVVNGASDLFEAVFLEKGRHARAAVGVSSLPENAAVEVELIAYID